MPWDPPKTDKILMKKSTIDSGKKVLFADLINLNFKEFDNIYTEFKDLNDNKCFLQRISNCILNGNLLRYKNNILECERIVTRCDDFLKNRNFKTFHTPYISKISDKICNSANTNNVGFLFRTLKDCSYPMFVVSCLPLFWYLNKILKNMNYDKISIVITGINGGWYNEFESIAARLQSEYIQKIKKEKNLTWGEIHKNILNSTNLGIELKENIKNYIIEWRKMNKYTIKYKNKNIEDVEIAFDLCYIKEFINLLCENYKDKIEIIEQNKPLKFNYLFIGSPLSANFVNFFPKLNPPVNNMFSNLRKISLNKNITVSSKNERFIISRDDRNMGRDNGSGERIITNKDQLFDLLTKNNFNIINASYYKTEEKFHLFNNGKIFILFEGGGLANMLFFPPNSKIIIILNGGWGNMTDGKENWWIKWNKEHYGHLNHKIYLYDNITCLRKTCSNINTKINDINHFHKFLINII